MLTRIRATRQHTFAIPFFFVQTPRPTARRDETRRDETAEIV